jgi:hypothetical protein
MHIRDAVLRPALGQPVTARRSPAEGGAGCMVGSAPVLRAAAGTATTDAGTGLQRRLLGTSDYRMSRQRQPLGAGHLYTATMGTEH